MLSVVIPTLNASESLPRLLSQLQGPDLQIIVSDGLSEDSSQIIAIQHGTNLAIGSASRGAQLRRGSQMAKADWILFIHADSRLTEDWREHVGAHINTHPDKAGFFGLKYDSPGFSARWVELMAAWRSMTIAFPKGWALPYGDQGLLISRTLYDEIGGYPDWPLFEDVKIVEKLGRTRIRHLGCKIITCDSNYKRDGFIKRGWRNFKLLRRYKKGEAVENLLKDYT